jgi:hypothetical protein
VVSPGFRVCRGSAWVSLVGVVHANALKRYGHAVSSEVTAVATAIVEGALAKRLRRVDPERRPQLRRRLLRGLLGSGLAFAVGIAVAVLFEGAAQVAGLVVGGVSFALLLGLQMAVVALDDLARMPSLQDRIAVLAASLTKAASAIDEVDREVQARRALVSELERDASRYASLTELRSAEVEAVAQSLRGELHQAGRRSTRLSLIQNVVFFTLGVGASVLVSVILDG